MNKPLDPEHVANENMAAETNETLSPQEEVVKSTENQAEVIEDQAEEPVEVAETPMKTEQPAVEPVVEAEPEKKEEEALCDQPETDKLSKEEIVEKLKATVEEPVTEAIRAAVESLKQSFYKYRRQELDEARKAFVEAGGLEEEFKAEKDELEETLKELLAAFKAKKAALAAEEEKAKEDNLNAKKSILEKIKELTDSKDDFYKVYNEFRKLQQEWKEIKQVPQAAINDLWKEYQHYSEKFYDLVKINNEMRDYDFKKNLELKQALCEAVERLDQEQDVISAFYQLQNFHQEWREIGPVSKELREEIWTRFKDASTVINKKHQQYFESLRELEEHNLAQKTALCEEIETIDFSAFATFKDWDEASKKVLGLQAQWKTLGFAPRKHNVKIFERFRSACDAFFSKKAEFFRGLKSNMDENMEKKTALCEKAEELKDSQNWKEATDKMVALQKEWKTIGPVPRKYSDAIWKRFIAACDHFFEQKKQNFSSQKTEEVENLKKKRDIIARIMEVDESLEAKEAIAQIRELMNEFNGVGFVPFKEKDKVYKEYRSAVDKHFDRLKVDQSQRRLESFKNNLTEMSGDGKSKGRVLSERERLMRTYERLRNDIQTYENNIGFLSVSSKGGGGLVKEMERKIESLKEELVLIEKKIEVIDQSLETEK